MKLRCAGCGLYVEKDEAVRIGIQSFCNMACRMVKKPKKVSSVRKKRKPSTDSVVRRYIRERDGGCRFCGTKRNLHVHHITYRSQGGSDHESNLITLCLTHHELVHTDKPRFAPLCRGVVWLTYCGKRYTIPQFERVLGRHSENHHLVLSA